MVHSSNNNGQTVIHHFGGGGDGGFWLDLAKPPSKTDFSVTAIAGNAFFATVFYTGTSGRLKSPWSRRRKKHALSPQQWRSLFTPDGRLRDGGIKFLKKVRSRGVDPGIRAEVWPFLLGVYDLNSSEEERDAVRTQKKEYEKLRRECSQLPKPSTRSFNLPEICGTCQNGDSESLNQETDTSSSEDGVSARESLSSEERNPNADYSDEPSNTLMEGDDSSRRTTNADVSALNSESSDSDSSEDPEVIQGSTFLDGEEENDTDVPLKRKFSPSTNEWLSKLHATEDFSTWQRIIRLDAIRANTEWMPYSVSQAAVSDRRARRLAKAVGLKDYDHLEPYVIFHAARLVTILEAYALYDPEIGYCQGMSDLLSPIISVIPDDYEAFWCFVGFMKKARHNFRLDEVGIRRQLNIVSKIIKCKDSHLYRHLEKLKAEDCFFVYRMVVVLFRRELTFEQTICLWEVMWADQAAIRAGIGKSAWSRIRQRAPPTDDLLLYAIAASVLQKRKLIIENYGSTDDIITECNSMSGQLDVWKLLNDAHDLVVTLHDKIESTF
ncbi:hypothetical protein GOBAR_AA39004 [Gossypium barbadense]|uniref:Rab-GAP TBC domain-containing protein n=1 Tax=Gossypium barbadense TaxID=3634 RepID=A0A2P5VSD6_GOSBA|nr:hypothetical protein GOBAR_AA39004 [Gossypium barbadense]